MRLNSESCLGNTWAAKIKKEFTFKQRQFYKQRFSDCSQRLHFPATSFIGKQDSSFTSQESHKGMRPSPV